MHKDFFLETIPWLFLFKSQKEPLRFIFIYASVPVRIHDQWINKKIKYTQINFKWTIIFSTGSDFVLLLSFPPLAFLLKKRHTAQVFHMQLYLHSDSLSCLNIDSIKRILKSMILKKRLFDNDCPVEDYGTLYNYKYILRTLKPTIE